ncbi:MAG: phosphoglycerate dehydrogenase [Anaerolinea sp.]|nr:phosphoglycerate dehydrogenase [Anaerolinea sp.]
MPTILIATDLTEESLKILRLSEDMNVQFSAPTLPALRTALADADAIICRDDVIIDKALLDGAPRLRVIGRVGASLGGIDLDAATNRGIIVMNTPGANAIAAGEYALALLLALSRRLIPAHNSLKEGWWLLDRKRHAGIQLLNKTLGIVGLGRVGQVVAQRALAFGMTVLACDPYLPDDAVFDSRIQLVSLKELLARADFVTLHVPATSETRGMVNADFIAQMKPGARLINTAFGGLVDEAALAEAIKSGHLAGAAIDVYSEEPPYNSPIRGLDNVVHTPHIADNTVEATQDLSIQIVRQVVDALRGEDYRNVVNLPFLPGMDFETARPYMTLAERMAAILHTLARTPIARLAVETRGEDVERLIKPVTVALLKGLLAPMLGADTVNYINAPVLAAERGIQVTQAKGLRSSDYASIIVCQAVLNSGEAITISGTLLDRRTPYIVQINDYHMHFIPAGHLLIMGSYDQPGVIGRVGTLLAENGINIASWQTGRAAPGGQTLTVLTLDEPAPDATLAALRAQDFVRHAHQVALE